MVCKQMKINIISDSNNSFQPIEEIGKKSFNVERIYGQNNFDGITLFWDNCLDDEHIHIIDKINSKYKFAILHDPRAIHEVQNKRYKNAEKYIDKFDKILTHDEYLLDKYHDKCLFGVDNCIWVSDSEIKIHNKTKLCSLIYSWKNDTAGHRLRHQIANLNIDGLDLFGNGSKHPIEFKEEGLADYQYSIIIENSRSKYYFTEKILDAFACGTIPIYWGCTNIEDFFNIKGIMQFNNIEELISILDKINENDFYSTLKDEIKNNFELAKKHIRYDDWFYNNIYINFK